MYILTGFVIAAVVSAVWSALKKEDFVEFLSRFAFTFCFSIILALIFGEFKIG